MGAEIINLRRARKQRQRAEAQSKAAENRVRFGRSKDARRHDDANKLLEKSKLDALIRERPDTKDDS